MCQSQVVSIHIQRSSTWAGKEVIKFNDKFIKFGIIFAQMRAYVYQCFPINFYSYTFFAARSTSPTERHSAGRFRFCSIWRRRRSMFAASLATSSRETTHLDRLRWGGRVIKIGKISRFKFCKFLAGSFSAVPKWNFARKYAFDSISQALQDLLTSAPLQSQNFSKKSIWKINNFRENSANIS